MASTDSAISGRQTSASTFSRFFQNMRIGSKLTVGFGIIVLLTLLVVGWSYLSSSRASENIETTSDVRVPIVLASSQAQADLLTMLGDVRGYLALGDEESREG